jgi:hypothetical protein
VIQHRQHEVLVDLAGEHVEQPVNEGQHGGFLTGFLQ